MKFMPTKKEWKWVIGIVIAAITAGVLIGALASLRMR